MRRDPYTGRPIDHLTDLLSSATGKRCEDCGTEIIDRCLRCGAPQCCPRCCVEAMEEAQP